MRIGNMDGFSVRQTSKLAGSPFLNCDGIVRVFSDYDFDNWLPGQLLDQTNFCQGCAKFHNVNAGSNWTDIAISASALVRERPDEDNPQTPNNPDFGFDFRVKKGDIPRGATIFVNMVCGE